MTTYKLLLLPGDGIGPEVMAEVKRLLGFMAKTGIATFATEEGLVGGAADDAHGVLADEAMQAWSDWRPLATQAIRLFGFFVKPKVGKIDADGL